MTEPRIENARITSTMLGIEDHGILTCFIHLLGDGWGCGFGGYVLDQWDDAHKQRVGTAFAADCILGILAAVGVEKWEDLPGKYVRAKTEGPGGGILAIGHIVEDRWFNLRAAAQQARARNALGKLE